MFKYLFVLYAHVRTYIRTYTHTYMHHCKSSALCPPSIQSEYPTVDGALSIQSYFTALDSCYRKYKQKFSSRRPTPASSGGKGDAGADLIKGVPSDSSTSSKFDLDSAEAFLFHTPFSKLVQKSLGRLLYNDFKMEVYSI